MSVLFLCNSIFVTVLHSSAHVKNAQQIAQKTANPVHYLNQVGPLVVMGNSSLTSAEIVFLPEIHDDPDSLLTQLLLIAREKKQNDRFMVLDESISSMKKSVWDIFSQKTLEILAAGDQRRSKNSYSPSRFEGLLRNLADEFKSQPGQMRFLKGAKVWALADFLSDATPFYGWDSNPKDSLTKRNVQMVESIKSALKNNDRILVMAGARHIPELEFLTSKKLICSKDIPQNIDSYFLSINKNFGNHPVLKHGIGATAPIFNFLTKKRYAVVFSKRLYKELDRVVQHFADQVNRNGCFKLAQ